MELLKTMLVLFHIYLFILSFCRAEEITTEDGANVIEKSPPSVTQTVYGFLDFTTTIGNTVMVFSPQSAATTSAKPTEPVTIIKEKPQSETTVVEIVPSKAITESLPKKVTSEISDASSLFLTSSGVTSSSLSSTTATDEEKDISSLPTKTTSPVTTISQNTTTTKIKSGKATPKSLGIISGTQSKPVSKDRPKTLSLKVQSVTESTTVTSQIASTTKKSVDKKTTAKADNTTKPIIKVKTEKVNKPHVVVAGNSSSKGKLVAKTEKPKTSTSTKTSNKPTSPVYVPESSPSKPEEPAQSSVLIASKIEVREGATSIQKMKKSDVEPTVAQTPNLSSVAEAKPVTEQQDQHTFTSDVTKSEPEAKNATEEPAVISSSGVSAPEYDFLSRQPSEVIDETFRIIDLKPNSGKYPKSKTGTSNAYRATTPAEVYEETQPLGIITSLSDSVIRDGMTTVYETNVIGTVVSGKYAQVLQSNSHVQANAKKIKPSSTVRILKTAAPTYKGSSSYRVPSLEATPTYEEESSSVQLEMLYNGDQGIKPSRKPTLGSNSYSKNKHSPNKNKYKEDFKDDYGTTAVEEDETLDTDYTAPGNSSTSPAYQASTPSTKKATTKKSNLSGRPFKSSSNRFQRPTTPELATVSVFSDTQASVTPSYGSGNRRFSPSGRRTTSKPATSTESEKNYTNAKRSYKTKSGSSSVENNNINPPATPSSFKFKLNRPTGRWQYKTSPKPRVTIRRQDESLDNVTVSPIPQFTPDIQLEGNDQELSGSGIYPALQHEDNSIVHDVTPTLTAETLRVEISTPADFKDVYYEIATIKSPYSFQIGTVKNTRFITVTSTFEKSLVQATESPTIVKTEPLSENILASTHNAYDKDPPLDSSIATLPPIGLAGDAETPPLETMTESFSTTQLMLKTHVLPVVRGGSDTTTYTLVQSYHVTRLVTAVKTLPPMEVYQFVPSRTLNEFNTRLDEAGSEVHLELDFGDNNEHDDEPRPNVAKALLSDLDLTNIGSNFDIADVDRNKILEQHLRAKKAHHKTSTISTTPLPSGTPEAPTTPALRAEQLQQLALLRLLNPNGGLPNVITSSRPIYKVETAYETFLLPISAGGSTFFSTISKPTATVTKTEYEYVTNTLPMQQSSVFNPLFPQQPSFQIATTPIFTQTMLTETDSKVLKLTFGAKTSYTTLFSTKLTPTILTTYLTNSIPIQATISPFSGFFNPAPYGFNAPFPFVG